MLKNIIECCQWFMKCSHPLYDGECRKDCFDRYYNTLRLEIDNNAKEKE